MKTTGNAYSKILTFLIYMIFGLFTFVNLYPLVWLLYSSFKTNLEFSKNLFNLPEALQFVNYENAWRVSRVSTYFLNSVYVTIISVGIIIVLAMMVSYVLARYQFKYRNMIYFFFLLGMLIPMHSILVPIFTMYRSLRMLDKWFTLFFPYAAFGMPFAIYILESYIASIPKDIDEAATIDGCGRFKLLFRIIFPIAGPAVATVCIMTFLNIWNDFIFPLILISSDSLKTIQLGLQNFLGPRSADYPQLMAALVISTTPVIVTYLLFQKKLIKGMVAGAVKG